MPEEKKEVIRRAPSVPIRIKDLKQTEGRVAIIGTVTSKNPELYSFVLDNGESHVLVLTNNIGEFERLKEGQFVRVLGKVWGEGDEIEIQADIVQDFSKIDKDLYKRVFYKEQR